MGQVGKYLRRVEGGYAHYCPGCDHLHAYATDKPLENGSRWAFDGNLNAPSFTPSMNIGDNWCHYYLTAGELIYCGGLKGHGLSGQTIPLPELPAEYCD